MASLEKSVICPILVGREPQLEAILRICASVWEGAGRVVLIAGEAGLGKSRLANETAVRLEAEGWVILRGQCSEYEQEQAYAPLIDMLRAYGAGRASAELARLLGPEAQALVGLLPELAHALAEPTRPATTEKQLLFPALARLYAQLADGTGLLLVVEDLHWGDEASLDLLRYLARHLSGLPIMLLITYRANEVGPALAQFLAQLDRQRLAVELRLAPLTALEVDRMLCAIFEQAQPIRPEFLDPIYALTEGNPFFIEETLKAMLTAGEIYYAEGSWQRKSLAELHIPRSVDETLRRRSQQLSPQARELLSLAAVAGRHFAFTLLQRLTGLSEHELLACLKELIAAQFVVEENAEHFAFRHALTRHAVYATLLARERRRLHQAIAEALVALAPGNLEVAPADLAYHYAESELWSEALQYARQAAEQALALYAPAAALAQLERARTAECRLELAPDPALFVHAGRAHAPRSEFAAARAALEQAFQLAEERLLERIAWQALIALGDLWATRDYRRSGDYLAMALERARTLADKAVIAESLNYLGNWHMNLERPAEAVELHREALAIFRQCGDRPGIAQTLDLLAISSNNCGDLIGGQVFFEQAIALWRELNDRRGLIHSLGGLSLAIDYRLEFSETTVTQALRSVDESVTLARAIGWRSGEALALICRGLVLGQGGIYGEALATLRSALTIAEAIEHLGWTTDSLHALGALHLELLALDDARTLLERSLELARELGSLIWVRHASAPLAIVCTYQGDPGRAETLITAALGDETATTLGARMLEGARAELALALGEPAVALAIIERLIRETRNLGGRADGLVAQLWYLRGRALSALDQHAAAATDLAAARSAAARGGRRGLLWRIHAALAHVYLALGRPGEAGRERSAARELIDTLAAELASAALAGPDAARLAGQFAREAAGLLPAEGTAGASSVLTAREREVAMLLARGKSNREIAAALVLSERTAERHVANIMAKLNVHSRAQIAAWAVQAGLVQEL